MCSGLREMIQILVGVPTQRAHADQEAQLLLGNAYANRKRTILGVETKSLEWEWKARMERMRYYQIEWNKGVTCQWMSGTRAPDVILRWLSLCSPLWTSTVVPATVEMKSSPFDKCLKTIGIPSQNH